MPGRVHAATGAVQGQITAAGTDAPIEGARVTLDLEPTNGVPDYTALSSPFGFYRLPAVNAGSYRWRVEHPAFAPLEQTIVVQAGAALAQNAALAPLGGSFFDVFVQVSDVTSGLQLGGVPIVIERYASALDIVPLESRALNTDTNGYGVFRGMQNGHYRFAANNGGGARPKWEAFTNIPTAGSKPLLTKAHTATLLLKPIPQDLFVRVTGFNPVGGGSGAPITNVFVELTGLDPADTNRVLVPPRTGVTETNGVAQFTKLPAIAWRIRAKKFGYNQAEQIVFPNASGDFAPGNTAGNPVAVSLNIIPTHLYVNTTHPYRVTPLFDYLTMRIEGLTNTTAEGVSRSANYYNVANLRDDRDFQFLLPGRYRVTMNGQPQFGSLGIRPQFVGEDYVDVPPGVSSNGGYTDLILPLNVVPATVRGRLFVADESSTIETSASSDSYSAPRYLPRATVPVEIIEFTTNLLLKVQFRTNVVTTDANGEFTLTLLPALYGIRIPALAGYRGHEVRLRNLTTTITGEKDITQGWPFPEPWPHPLSGAAPSLKFNSGHDYRLDLFVQKPLTTIKGTVAQAGGGAYDLVLTNLPATVTLLTSPGGAVVRTQPLTSELYSFEFRDVSPGAYTYALDHRRFTFDYGNGSNVPPTPVTFISTVAAPGVIPATDPGTDGTVPPFQNILLPPITANALMGTAEIEFHLHRWELGAYNTNPYPHQPFVSSVTPDYSGKLATGGPFRPPEGGFNFLAILHTGTRTVYYTNRVGAPTGHYDFDVYFANSGDHGPLGNVLDSPPRRPYDWTIQFVNDADLTQVISDPTTFTLDLLGFDIVQTATGTFFTNWAGSQNISAVSNPHWVFVGSSYGLTDHSTPAYKTTVRLRRGTSFQGGVTNNAANTPVASAKVQLKDRFGNVLRDTLSDSNGVFAIAGQLNKAEPVFLDITAPGFKPHRSRHTAVEAVPDPVDPAKSLITLSPRLDPIFPAPVIQQLAMDRQGLFLPGVRLAGNQSALDAFQAIGPLTMTWTLFAQSTPVAASLVPFDNVNGSSNAPQNLSLEDPIQEVWLVDPRGFTNNAYVGAPIPIPPPPTNQGHHVVLTWLQNIATNQLTNVFYLRVTNITVTVNPGQIVVTSTVPVWKLPPGDFKPLFFAVTQRGAVAYLNPFAVPGSPAQLTGIRAPRWAAFALDLMGGVAGLAATQEKVKEWVPDGEFLPLPIFTADIENDENGYLLYNYEFDVNWTAGQDGPASGLAALAPGLLGLEFNGVFNFGLNGAGTNFFLDASADVTLPDVKLSRFLPKAATNAVPLSAIHLEESVLNVTARKLGARNYAPATQPYEFEMTNSVSGSYNAKVTANLRPVTSKLPYIGPALLALDEAGELVINGVMTGGIGLGRTNIWRTPFPPAVESGGTSLDTNRHVLRRHFLGGTEVENHLALCFRFGTGLDVVFGRAHARALLNLGGNECAIGPGASKPAVLLELNPNADWPLVQRISGNLTATLDADLDLWVTSVGKSWEWELLAFEHSYNTDPFFQLVPMNIGTTITSPGAATAATFNGAGPVIISNFYPAGVFATAGGAGETLAFTEVNTATGNLRLKVAIRSGANPFGTPVTVATAAGIVAVDVAALPAGGWMAVWTQLAPGDVASPFPPSMIMSATSADGVTWSPPVQVAALTDVASELRLVTGSGLTGLAFLHTAEGPQASNFSLDVARWTGSAWSAPASLLASAAIRGFAAQGAGAASLQPAIIAVSQADAQLTAFTWNGTNATGPTLVTNNAAETLALATDGAGQFFLASKLAAGGIGLFKFDTTNGWASLGTPISAALPTELHLTPHADAGGLTLLLSWAEGGDVTSIWTAFVNAAGALLKAPSNLTLNTAGRFRDLQVLPRANRTAKVIARFEDGRHDVIEFSVGFDAAIALLDSPLRLGDGTFEFHFTGNPSQVYRIEASTNLIHWQTLTNFAAPTNGIFILDLGAKTIPYRFYRAVSP